MQIFTSKKQIQDYLSIHYDTVERMIKKGDIFEMEDIKERKLFIIREEMVSFIIKKLDATRDTTK